MCVRVCVCVPAGLRLPAPRAWKRVIGAIQVATVIGGTHVATGTTGAADAKKRTHGSSAVAGATSLGHRHVVPVLQRRISQSSVGLRAVDLLHLAAARVHRALRGQVGQTHQARAVLVQGQTQARAVGRDQAVGPTLELAVTEGGDAGEATSGTEAGGSRLRRPSGAGMTVREGRQCQSRRVGSCACEDVVPHLCVRTGVCPRQLALLRFVPTLTPLHT